MSENLDYILPLWESESIVQHMELTNLHDIGTKKWYEYHKQLIQLNQQSMYEISNMREETIKEWFINYQKIIILIYEAIQIDIWKIKIFPCIIDLYGSPKNTFMMFSVFYHENIAVSLMENLLFHYDCVEILDDTALDLIDYCINNIIPIIFSKESTTNDSLDNSCITELMQKKNEIEFNIGIMSISIIGYFTNFIENISLSILKRLLVTHDVPYLFIQLIEKHPWRKINSKGEEMVFTSTWEKLKKYEEDKICKVEGQVWIGLRELLLNPKCAPYYDITEFRLAELNKLQKYLHEHVLDQISPLIDLRRWLSCLNISATSVDSKPSLCIEIIPQIRDSIMNKYRGKWMKLAKLQSELFYKTDIEYVQDIAKILSVAYDFDKMDIKDKKLCAQCNDTATKRCSKCKNIWYCGRECQVKHWTIHKTTCEK